MSDLLVVLTAVSCRGDALLLLCGFVVFFIKKKKKKKKRSLFLIHYRPKENTRLKSERSHFSKWKNISKKRAGRFVKVFVVQMLCLFLRIIEQVTLLHLCTGQHH